jgi:hypothetical protein
MAGRKIDEAAWFAATSFVANYHLVAMASKNRRKERLFCIACCHRLGGRLSDPRSLAALGAGEQYAEGELSLPRLKAARRAVIEAARDSRRTKPDPNSWSPDEAAQNAVSLSRTEVLVTGPVRVAICLAWMGVRPRAEEDAFQAHLMHDIFDSTVRPVTFAPEWRTSNAVAIAQGMYESWDFGAMPILADALQDAGCDNDDVLNHCRDEKATHVRGCWVVDLVLGKK